MMEVDKINANDEIAKLIVVLSRGIDRDTEEVDEGVTIDGEVEGVTIDGDWGIIDLLFPIVGSFEFLSELDDDDDDWANGSDDDEGGNDNDDDDEGALGDDFFYIQNINNY